ncbi:hypothetical protein PMAYCL1PPCAC_30318, partial [Pristionchus mayeri]
YYVSVKGNNKEYNVTIKSTMSKEKTLLDAFLFSWSFNSIALSFFSTDESRRTARIGAASSQSQGTTGCGSIGSETAGVIHCTLPVSIGTDIRPYLGIVLSQGYCDSRDEKEDEEWRG